MARQPSLWPVGLCVLLAAARAGAVGLGDMVLTSPPGEPLRAEIPVEPVTAQELWALQVGVASERTFLRNGLDRAPELDELRFEIVRDSGGDGDGDGEGGGDGDGDSEGGGSVVRMTSPNPLASSMTLLLEATWLRRPDWPPGRLIRIYSFGPEDLPAAGARPRPVGAGSLGTHGPVGAGETLWSLATRFSALGTHPNQILVAIFEANPRGFGGNMNGIYEGATLRIPEAVQARRLTVEEATAEAIRQLDAWLAGAEGRGRPAPPTEPGEGGPAGESMPGPGELQAQLDDTRQLLESRDEELLALREQLLEARAAVEEAEDEAAVARAAVPPPPPPGLRGVWTELNRIASRAFAAAVAIGVGALFLVGILVGFLAGRRRGGGAQRRTPARMSAAEDTSGGAADDTYGHASKDIGEGSRAGEDTRSAADSLAAMEVESQLDLARAYIDMGDAAAAQRTLRAIVKAGDRDQRRQAESLLRELQPAARDK